MSRFRRERWMVLLLTAGLFGPATAPPAPAGPPSFFGSRAGDEREVVGVKLCWCPPGRFRMGSPPDETERRSTRLRSR